MHPQLFIVFDCLKDFQFLFAGKPATKRQERKRSMITGSTVRKPQLILNIFKLIY